MKNNKTILKASFLLIFIIGSISFLLAEPITCMKGDLKDPLDTASTYKISLDIDDCSSTCSPDGSYQCRDYSVVIPN